MTASARIVLQELVARPNTTPEIAALSAIDESDVIIQLQDVNDRIRRELGLTDNPISSTPEGTWRAEGIAGLIRFNSRVELEISPKFLDPTTAAWRSDFFLLAILVRTGHLLLHEEIRADTQDRADLATLIAISFLSLYEDNQRRPIRGYRHVRDDDYSLDGDVDWETLSLPTTNGFALSKMQLTAANQFNATIGAAVRLLIPEVTDGDTQHRLQHLSRRIGRQPVVPEVFPPLPQRHLSWQSTYSLAQLVVEGMGLELGGGTFTGPGFVLSTWSAWQSLCEQLVRRALPDAQVVPQASFILGTRGTDEVSVRPDLSVRKNQQLAFLADAKYKSRTGRALTIGASDLYESLAFLRAAGVTRIALLFPSARSVGELPLGQWTKFDSVEVDDLLVEGLEFQVQGVASGGGFQTLVHAFREGLQDP